MHKFQALTLSFIELSNIAVGIRVTFRGIHVNLAAFDVQETRRKTADCHYGDHYYKKQVILIRIASADYHTS